MAEVLVVGAGPTGLMAATLLARRGVAVRLIDRAAEPAQESRAFVLHARSLELMLKLGLEQRFLDEGVMMDGAEVFYAGRRVAQLNFQDVARADTPYSCVLLLPQSRIELLLLEDARRQGVVVERPTELTGLEQDGEGVTARFGDGSSGRFRYVVGADGAHSMVRKAAGLTFHGAPYPDTFLLADCVVDGAVCDNRARFFLSSRSFALQFPLRGTKLSRIYALAHSGEVEGTLPEVERHLKEAARLDLRLSDATWVARYKVHHRSVERYRLGRVLVAGDAAHIHSPAGGQGMNTGLQDAFNLGWKLAMVVRGEAPPALLGTYHEERWPVGQRVVKVTDRAFGAVTAGRGARLRDLVVPLLAGRLSRIGALRSKAFHYLSQLGIRYEPNFFVTDEGSSARARAGMRAPNAGVQRGLDVFGLTAGYDFVLLALSRVALDPEGVASARRELERACSGLATRVALVAPLVNGRTEGATQAETFEVFHSYGVPEGGRALVLVRPDGHVAYRCEGWEPAGLERFVARFRVSAGQQRQPGGGEQKQAGVVAGAAAGLQTVEVGESVEHVETGRAHEVVDQSHDDQGESDPGAQGGGERQGENE